MKPTDPAPPVAKSRWRAIHVFFTLICLVAGTMFFFKLHEFLQTVKNDELAGFAFDPIMTYGFVAAGFFLLLLWAFFTGQFKDIESTKYEMMDRVQAQERAEGLHFQEETL